MSGKRKYGMPYQGSKSAIAEGMIDVLPKAEHLYDIMAGGGAITHCAALSGKWTNIHYNEIDSVVTDGFRKAIRGEFANEDRFITRDEFFRLKDSDPYVRICFSFGNDCRTYCYGKKIEHYKEVLHEALVKGNSAHFEKMTGIHVGDLHGKTIPEKRAIFRKLIKDNLEKMNNNPSIPNEFENIATAHHVSSIARLQDIGNERQFSELQSLQSLQSLRELGTRCQ